jgi:hypothetical protein
LWETRSLLYRELGDHSQAAAMFCEAASQYDALVGPSTVTAAEPRARPYSRVQPVVPAHPPASSTSNAADAAVALYLIRRWSVKWLLAIPTL